MAGNVWEWVTDWFEPNYYLGRRTATRKDRPTGMIEFCEAARGTTRTGMSGLPIASGLLRTSATTASVSGASARDNIWGITAQESFIDGFDLGQMLQSRYRILRPFGQGGMGAVYLAEDMRLGSRCAVKESVPDPAASPQALAQLRAQFELEARTLAGLSHPNLPKVTDYFSESGNEYLVMEYMEGEDLASVLARHGGPLPEKPVLIWADQVLDALDYLHGQPRPIIHRDIKPANIILAPQGKVKLVDFGLVKLYDPTNPRTATAMKGMGTPEYTPLEQYAGGAGHTDARSDIYALGAMLYHLLTGVTPVNVPQRSLNPGSLIAPRQVVPALSAVTEAAVLKAIAVHPDQRFQTAREMRTALAAPPWHPHGRPLQHRSHCRPCRCPPGRPVYRRPAPGRVRRLLRWSARRC